MKRGCLLPDSDGLAGMSEKLAAAVVTHLSKLGTLGNYVESCGVKL